MKSSQPGKIASVRVVVWLAVGSAIVTSVLPGDLRPQLTDIDYLEHFAAYFVIGGLFGIAYPRPRQLAAGAIMLVMCSGALEIVQHWIPDRTASIGDFAASAAGAGTGLILACITRRIATFIRTGSGSVPSPDEAMKAPCVQLPEGTTLDAFCTVSSLLPGTLPSGSDASGGLAIHCLDVTQPVARQLAEGRIAVCGSAWRKARQ
jgi:VanZ family protein